MFESVDCYSGGVYLPETKQETNEVAEAEARNSAAGAFPEAGSTDVQAHGSITPETIIQNAYREADRIIAEATDRAENDAEAIVSDARTYADEVSANAVVDAVSKLELDLWSSRHALTQIVEQALCSMVGKIGEGECCYGAVENAIRKYCKSKKVTVFADSRTADRLRLVALTNRSSSSVDMFDIVDDDNLHPGRCVIDAEGHKLEVSLESQIAAIKKACNHQIASLAPSQGGKEQGGLST